MKKVIFIGFILILIMSFNCKEDKVDYDVKVLTEIQCETYGYLLHTLQVDVSILLTLQANLERAIPHNRRYSDSVRNGFRVAIEYKQKEIERVSKRWNEEREKLKKLKEEK